jgi:hypothetical protein
MNILASIESTILIHAFSFCCAPNCEWNWRWNKHQAYWIYIYISEPRYYPWLYDLTSFVIYTSLSNHFHSWGVIDVSQQRSRFSPRAVHVLSDAEPRTVLPANNHSISSLYWSNPPPPLVLCDRRDQSARYPNLCPSLELRLWPAFAWTEWWRWVELPPNVWICRC